MIRSKTANDDDFSVDTEHLQNYINTIEPKDLATRSVNYTVITTRQIPIGQRRHEQTVFHIRATMIKHHGAFRHTEKVFNISTTTRNRKEADSARLKLQLETSWGLNNQAEHRKAA